MLKSLALMTCGLLLYACSAGAEKVSDAAVAPAPQEAPADAFSTDALSTDAPTTGAPVAAASFYQQHCGICHLGAGEGVPGAFPPLDQRLAGWAQTEAGQGYLVSVIANGLYGVLQVNGQQYAGAMPGLKGQLTNSEIASLLNYVLIEFSGSSALYTQASVQAHLDAVGAGPSLPLRPE